jgi:hypothetical protein
VARCRPPSWLAAGVFAARPRIDDLASLVVVLERHRGDGRIL